MGILEKIDDEIYRVGTEMRVELAGDTATHHISGEDQPRVYRMRIEDEDTLDLYP